jgi:FAD synthase
LRGEKEFKDVDELVSTIKDDILYIKEVLWYNFSVRQLP